MTRAASWTMRLAISALLTWRRTLGLALNFQLRPSTTPSTPVLNRARSFDYLQRGARIHNHVEIASPTLLFIDHCKNIAPVVKNAHSPHDGRQSVCGGPGSIHPNRILCLACGLRSFFSSA